MMNTYFKKRQGADMGVTINGAKLYAEDFFRDMIAIERRRAERSKKSFILMLLDMRDIPEADRSKDFTRDMGKALISSTREVDVKGWYRKDKVIGVIFFEMSVQEIDRLNEKVLGGLNRCGIVDSPLFDKVQITYHSFPEKSNLDKKDIEFDFDLYPDLTDRDAAKKQSFYMKRIIDIIGSILAIIIFLPVFILVPVFMKLTSRGPVFFRQKRIGAYGRPFTLLKFRSMCVDNDESVHQDYIKKLILEEKVHCGDEGADKGGKTYKIKNDSRVTPFGRFLRKTSLDEVPQFMNVLTGSMSLVGPRPPIPYELQNYDTWHLRRVLEFKPGITGLWQVKGRSRTTFNEMVRMDINYINQWSIWLDLKLVIMTPLAVLSSRGAH